MPRAAGSTGIRPRACTASVWTSVLGLRPVHGFGDPTHILDHPRLVVDEHDRNKHGLRTHGGGDRLRRDAAGRVASDDGERGRADLLEAASGLEHRLVLDRADDDVPAALGVVPLRTPLSARLSASVPEPVKTISPWAHSSTPASRSRAWSTAARAARPDRCTDDGLPCVVVKYGSISSRTRGATGVVAAWSRWMRVTPWEARARGRARRARARSPRR